jgi:NADH-quinone oxidoreductase subunit N
MLLYGASMIYGFAGTTGFLGLAAALTDSAAAPVGLIIGLVFVLAGLAFKVSAVPFHMWTPDVYEGAPTPVTAFFSAAPKIAAVALLTRVVVGPFGHLMADWRQVIVFISIASMLLGAVAGINQRNIKRLMAYSSIGHIGYGLVGLAAGTPEGVRGLLIYMSLYVVMTLGSFGCILSMRRRGVMVEQIADLAGVSRSNPMMAGALAIFMFSMAGIPPLAGFFGKLYVFLPAISAGLYTLAVIGVLASVVGAYYYLRVIKVMYFDELKEGFDASTGWEVPSIMAVMALATLLFFILPGRSSRRHGAGRVALAVGPVVIWAPPSSRSSPQRIGSTNEELHRRARAGAAENALVWAREQSRGRGRRGGTGAPRAVSISRSCRPGGTGAAPRSASLPPWPWPRPSRASCPRAGGSAANGRTIC